MTDIPDKAVEAARVTYLAKVREYDRDFRGDDVRGAKWAEKYGTNLHSTSLGESWAMRAALSAASPFMGAVVKPLDWPDECPRGKRVKSKGGLIQYTIVLYGGSNPELPAIYRWGRYEGAWSDPCETYEAAKAAAQADYEACIRSVFIPAVPHWPDPLDSPQARAIRAGKIDDTEIRDLFDRMERELKLLREAKAGAFPAPVPQEAPAEPVAPCNLPDPSASDCKNMKEVGGGFEGERYRCAVCGKGYFLDYEDMK